MPPGGGKCASGPSTSALGGLVGESSRLQRRCQAYPGSAETVTGRTRSSRDTRETPSAVPVTTRRTVLSPTAAMLFVASPTSRLLGSGSEKWRAVRLGSGCSRSMVYRRERAQIRFVDDERVLGRPGRAP